MTTAQSRLVWFASASQVVGTLLIGGMLVMQTRMLRSQERIERGQIQLKAVVDSGVAADRETSRVLTRAERMGDSARRANAAVRDSIARVQRDSARRR
ncbi:MAG: hypothetical protein ACRENP_21075 [Longimicrobiales bacterium]